MDYFKYIIRIRFVIFFIILSFNGKGQGKKGKFLHFSEDEGMSNSVINSIYQDDRGFMWFGSQDGLNRFDGYEFSISKSIEGDKSTISGNYVNDIIRKDADNIWIATEGGGICEFNRGVRKYTHVPLMTLPSISSNP